MAEIDKESLIAEVKDLVEKLRPALDADKKRITQDGRKFDVLQWVSGAPDSGKYPAGPAFLVCVLYLGCSPRRASDRNSFAANGHKANVVPLFDAYDCTRRCANSFRRSVFLWHGFCSRLVFPHDWMLVGGF